MEYIMENDAKKEKEWKKEEKYTKSKEGGHCKGEKRWKEGQTESPKSDPLVQASPQCR